MGKVNVRIELSIEFYNNFFIGGGIGDGNINSYILKNAEGYPYIPASTIKGVISQYAQRIRNILDYKNIDILFGKSNNSLGLLYFRNGVLEDKEDYNSIKSMLFKLKTGIKIDPFFKTAEKGHLRTIEVSGENIRFISEIQGYIKEEDYKSDVAFIVSIIKIIPALGGRVSSGLGWLKKHIGYKVFINEKDITSEEINRWIRRLYERRN